MGEIFELKEFSGERRRELLPKASGSAQILFFTGVRYEKYTDTTQMAVWVGPHDGASSGNGRKKRKA